MAEQGFSNSENVDSSSSPKDRAFTIKAKEEADVPAKFKTGKQVWLEAKGDQAARRVEIVDSFKNSDNKWEYKVKDLNGDLVNSGERVAETELQRNANR